MYTNSLPLEHLAKSDQIFVIDETRMTQKGCGALPRSKRVLSMPESILRITVLSGCRLH